jgi:hypothetical protein
MLDGAPVTDVSRRNAEAMIERIAGWTRERSRAGALD